MNFVAFMLWCYPTFPPISLTFLFTGPLTSVSSQAQKSKSACGLHTGLTSLVEAIMISYKKIADHSGC